MALKEYPVTGEKTDSNLRVDYEEVLNLKETYKFMREWLNFEGYADGDTEQLMEKFYLERVTQGGAKEMWIWWRVEKSPTTKYFKRKLNIDMHVLGMKDIEIMHKGNKIKAQRGEYECFVNGVLEFDPKSELPKVPIFGAFVDLFRKRTYLADIERERLHFRDDCLRLQGALKQFLELRGFLPESEMFQSPRGLG